MTATAQPSARATATATAAATAAATAPARRPAHAPATAPAPKRPPLRVVQPGEKVAKAGRRRPHPRLLVAVTVLIGAALLFGLVAAHVLLTQNQFRLQKVQRQAAEEQARYERLRAEVAELESPGRIVAAAQQRLGMVPPASVKYLTPATAQTNTGQAGTDRDAAGDTPKPAGKQAVPRSSATAGPADDEQAMAEWSEVKRSLSRP